MDLESESPVLSLLIIADKGIDVFGLVCGAYNVAREDEFGQGLSDDEMADTIIAVWKGLVCRDPARVAWRLTVVFEPQEIETSEGITSFAGTVADGLVELARQATSGVRAVIKIADSAQLHGHTALYGQVYGLEMALREIVSYIFASEFPDNLIDGLAKTTVKPASTENLPQDAQLIKHGENRFFYVLFDKYAVLNDSPDLKAAHIAAALQGGTNLNEVREALDLRPIKEERHAGFLASLQTLMDPLERVRNAVAHNRTVPEAVRENFHKAAAKLREEVDSFWKREAEHVDSGDSPPEPPTAPTPDPAA